MKTKDYKKYKVKHSTLEALYAGEEKALKILKANIEGVISTEAPVTLSTLKARLRESYDVAKISQKALDIIEDVIAKGGYDATENLYDTVFWDKKGAYDIRYLRTSDRLIYDIPKEELSNLVEELSVNCNGEALKREILAYFHLEVLTKKVSDYLDYVISYTRKK